MNYKKETELVFDVDCYWESHDMGIKGSYTYPSLPEPFINLYFSVHSTHHASIKGISSTPGFFEMKSKLFGVRLYLKGFFQLHLCQCHMISNKIKDIRDIGSKSEQELAENISKAASFEDRILIFKNYFSDKQHIPVSPKEINISNAVQYLIDSYADPAVIQNYAFKQSISSKTVTRWVDKEIGVTPKKLAKIVRFNAALYALHSYKTVGFYLDFGYFDQAHFLRDFKEFTGTSPEKYLKMVSDLYNP